jgi:hypothetical protein
VTVRLALLAGRRAPAPGLRVRTTLSPESVVRAWSQALNTDDNERAADLFAPNAESFSPGRCWLQ